MKYQHTPLKQLSLPLANSPALDQDNHLVTKDINTSSASNQSTDSTKHVKEKERSSFVDRLTRKSSKRSNKKEKETKREESFQGDDELTEREACPFAGGCASLDPGHFLMYKHTIENEERSFGIEEETVKSLPSPRSKIPPPVPRKPVRDGSSPTVRMESIGDGFSERKNVIPSSAL